MVIISYRLGGLFVVFGRDNDYRDLRGLCSVPEACSMGGNGEMHAQVVCEPPVLLSLC